MTALTGPQHNQKGDLLRFDNSGSGVTGSFQIVYDGNGVACGYKVSNLGIVAGNIQLTGNTVTTTSGNLTITPPTTFSGTATFSGSPPLSFSGYTFSIGGNFSTAGAFSTTGLVSITGNFSTAGAFSTTGLVSITGNLSTAGPFSTFGAYQCYITTTANTSVIFPVSGTLGTLAGTETLSNKTLSAVVLGTPSSGTLTNCTGLPPAGLSAPVTLAKGGAGQAVTQALVQRSVNTIAGASGSTTIPYGSSAPTTSNGTQVASISFTPTSASNRVRIYVQTHAGAQNSNNIILALFNGSTCLKTAIANLGAASETEISMLYDHIPGSTSAQTYSLRMGLSSAGTWTVSSTGANVTMGSTFIGYIVIEEFTP